MMILFVLNCLIPSVLAATAADVNEYESSLKVIESLVSVGKIQSVRGQLSLTMLRYQDARTRCLAARETIKKAQGEIDYWKKLSTEIEGHRKGDYIVRFSKVVNELRALSKDVDRCVDDGTRGGDDDPPPAPKQPPTKGDGGAAS